jgi:glycosyltransferase involved in cell wall biosynthesis
MEMSEVANGILLVTPLKNEAAHLKEVIRHIVNQTLKPVMWILVDDHSVDGSTEICQEADKKYTWIKSLILRDDPVKRQLGPHVYKVLRTGYEHGVELCGREGIDYRYVGFMDADMLPETNYYEKLVEIFKNNPEMGIISGSVYVRDKRGRIRNEKQPVQWPWGGARLLTRQCLDDIGGIAQTNSADAVAAIRAMKCGYRIRQFKEIRVVQVRATSSANGLYAGYFQKGIDDYHLGYSLLYSFVKGFQRSCRFSFPLGFCYAAGYLSSLMARKQRINDPVVREFCRGRLVRRLLARDLPANAGFWPKTIKS